MFFKEISYVCSPRLHLFNQNIAKTIVLWTIFLTNNCFVYKKIQKWLLCFWIYLKMEFIPVMQRCDADTENWSNGRWKFSFALQEQITN